MKKIYITPQTYTVTLSDCCHLLAGSEPTPGLPVKDEDEDPGNDGGTNLAKPNDSWQDVGSSARYGKGLWE